MQIVHTLAEQYAEAHTGVKGTRLLKFLSTGYYVTLRYITLLISIALFLAFLLSLFTEKYLLIVNEQDSGKFKFRIEDSFKFAGLFCLLLALLFLWISSQLKKINRRNNSITRLSALLKNILDTEGKNIEAEKQNYRDMLTMFENGGGGADIEAGTRE